MVKYRIHHSPYVRVACRQLITGSRVLGVDDVSGGAGVLQHVTPGVVGAVVGAADQRLRHRVLLRLGAAVAARHAARLPRAHLRHARLLILARDCAARHASPALSPVGDRYGFAGIAGGLP